jgi:hypothetical protein
MGGPRAAAVFLALVLAATSRGGATSRGSSSDEPPAAATCSFAAHDWNAAHTLKSVSATNPAECCAGCAAVPGCEAGILDAAGQCYLKAGLQSPTGCHNCTSCTLGKPPPGPTAQALEFGPKAFRLRLNPATLGLQNISVSSADGAFTQGFIMDTFPPPKQTEYDLWHLNITDCTATLPEGTRVTPCIESDCANTSHSLSSDGSALTLRWDGVPLPKPFTARLDVAVTITQLPDAKPGVALRGTVGLSPGSSGSDSAGQVCLQNLALPTLEGIPMRSEETDAMFVPDFFGHSGKCSGNCKMDMLQYWDGMVDQSTGTKEYAYMPNGNSRSMQWFAFYSNTTSKRLGLYAGAHDAGSHLQLAMATGAWPLPNGDGGGAALHWYHLPSNPLTPLGTVRYGPITQ